jgi:hypothetical protein
LRRRPRPKLGCGAKERRRRRYTLDRRLGGPQSLFELGGENKILFTVRAENRTSVVQPIH